MKKTLTTLVVLSVAWAATALDKADLDKKTTKLLAKFEKMQAKLDKRVPAEVLRRAQGIILLDRTKAGFIFAYQGGGGMAMVKDKTSGRWGPVAFLRANEGSLGFQIGGQQTFLVIVMTSSEGTRLLTDSSFEFGGEARGTAGDTSAGTEGTVNSAEQPVLVYDDRQGLFGGAAIKGGTLSPDEEANCLYYGAPLSLKEILFDKKAKATEAAATLAGKIAEYAKK